MITKDEAFALIGHFKEISDDAAAGLFAPLEEAAAAYFEKDDKLEQLVTDAAYMVTVDYSYRKNEYSKPGIIKKPKTGNEPKGYEDLRELFDAGDIWDAISGTGDDEFIAAFVFTSDTGGVGGGEPEYNSLIDAWTAALEAAREELLDGLQEIIDYCECNTSNNGLGLLLEDFGVLTKTPSRQELAERTYIDGGYLDIITMYGLNTHIPTYLQPENEE